MDYLGIGGAARTRRPLRLDQEAVAILALDPARRATSTAPGQAGLRVLIFRSNRLCRVVVWFRALTPENLLRRKTVFGHDAAVVV